MDKTPAQLLNLTLEDYLPQKPFQKSSKLALRPGHHLVYFPPFIREVDLLPDGTDPRQSPGEPFGRRMWAGGRMRFQSDGDLLFNVMPPLRCYERISKVTIKGLPGDEKIFVNIERKMVVAEPKEAPLQERGVILEDRNIVFIREKPTTEPKATGKRTHKILKAPHYSHEIIPSAALLFRFSALTFNAHRIHLDKQYCFNIEGHRNLLVHGPLSLVLTLEVLQHHLEYEQGYENPGRAIKEIEYRNLAPLYAEEKMKLCGRKNGEDKYDVWVEGRDGGLAVKGVVTVRSPRE